MPQIHLDYLSIFDWVWTTSARVSVLIILLLLVKYVLKNKIGARLHYLLWFVMIVSLLLPWTPQSSLSLYNLTNLGMQKTSPTIEDVKTFPPSASVDVVSSGQETGNRLEQLAVAPNPHIVLNTGESLHTIATSPFIHRFLFFIWIMGITVFIATTLVVNRRFIQSIKGQSVVDTKLLMALKEAKNKLNIKAEVPLIQTMEITSPSLFGLFFPRLLIPVGILEEFTSEQLNHVFVHELLHFKRKDVLVNWLTRGLLILHWFNPIIWYAFYKLREDQEIACDAVTLEHIGIIDLKDYAYTLIKLVESNSRLSRITSLASLSGSKSQLRRRITMINIFRKASLKWSLLVVTVVAALAFVTLTNAKASTATTLGTVTNINAGKQMPQSNQSSTLSDGSFNYHKYLAFTPLLPSYTAGYQLTLSRISCSQNTPPGNNSSNYLAAYGSHAAFSISEALPNEMHHSVFAQSTKTQIHIGDLPATLQSVDKTMDGNAQIQFTKNDVEYTVSSIPGGGISVDELKKICESIVVPVTTPPTDIYIGKGGAAASDGLSFKTLQPSDVAVPQGYKFRDESSQIYIKGDKKSEAFSLYYTTGKSSTFLNVQMTTGDQPYGFEPTPVLTPDSDFDTKQINRTTVKLRKTNNNNLPAAKIAIPENGLEFTLYGPDMQESEAEKVVTSILQAYTKL